MEPALAQVAFCAEMLVGLQKDCEKEETTLQKKMLRVAQVTKGDGARWRCRTVAM